MTWRLIRFLPPETAHRLAIWLLSIGERWDNLRWEAAQKKDDHL